jgi:plastocyanin
MNQATRPDVTPTMKITGSLVVCSLAAAFTAATLIINPDPAHHAVPAAPAVTLPGAPATVSIQQFAFSPVTAAPGAVVTVQNLDEVGHTVSATDGSFDSGVVEPATAGSFVAPTTPGVYTFICAIHPSMTGQLTVTP